MAKRRVTEVVRQGDGFDQVFIQVQSAGNGAGQLRHFQRMRQPGAKQITFVVQENLGFVDQAPKCRAVYDAVAVACKLCAGRRGRLGKAPATRLRGITGVRHKAHKLAAGSNDFTHQGVRRTLHDALARPVNQDEFNLARFGFFIDAHQLQVALSVGLY